MTKISLGKYSGNSDQFERGTIDGETVSTNVYEVLTEMNTYYSHVIVGGKHVVLSFIKDPLEAEQFQFESLADFPKRFFHFDVLNVNDRGMNRGIAWLKWSGKKMFTDGLAFYPDPAKCPPNKVNLFRGYLMSPVPGDVEPYLTHVRDVICAGDEIVYKYLIQYFAHMLQKPDEKPSIAIVLKSVEGTGKGSLIEPLLQIQGQYAIHTNGADLITGRFNSVIANKVLIFADEVDLTETKCANKLKALISETSLQIERKCIDAGTVSSFSRFIFASNMDTVLKAGSRERRYLVLEPSPIYAQNQDYFNRYFSWLNNNGAAHLMHYLQNVDISDFNPRQAPVTRALIEEKLANLDMPLAFMYGELCKERPFKGLIRPEPNDVLNMYASFLVENDHRANPAAMRSSIGKMFKNIGVISHGRSDRGQYYDLSDLSKLKDQFARRLGHTALDLF
jgi:putative DNA primase/helicase